MKMDISDKFRQQLNDLCDSVVSDEIVAIREKAEAKRIVNILKDDDREIDDIFTSMVLSIIQIERSHLDALAMIKDLEQNQAILVNTLKGIHDGLTNFCLHSYNDLDSLSSKLGLN